MMKSAALTSSPVHPVAEAQRLARGAAEAASGSSAPAAGPARVAVSPGTVDDHAPQRDRGAAFAQVLSGRGPTVTESSTRAAQAADMALGGAISTMSALARRPKVDAADVQRAERQLGYAADALSGLAGQGRLGEVEPTVVERLVERLGALEAAGAAFSQLTARVRQQPGTAASTAAASAAVVKAEEALSRLQAVAGELASASSARARPPALPRVDTDGPLAAHPAQLPVDEISTPRAAAMALMDAERALERSFRLLEVGDLRGFEAVLPEVRERVGEARAGIAQATLGDEPAPEVDVQRLQLAHAHLTQGREIGAWGGALSRVLGVDGKLTASTRDLAAQLSLPEGIRAAVRGDPRLVARLQPHLGPLVRDLAVVLAARDRVTSLAGL